MRFSASFPRGEKIPPILNPPKKERNYHASILLSVFPIRFLPLCLGSHRPRIIRPIGFWQIPFFFLRFFSKMFKCNLQNTIFQLLKSLLPEESFVINFTRRIYSINRNFFKIFYQQFLESILIEIVIQGRLNRKKERMKNRRQF